MTRVAITWIAAVGLAGCSLGMRGPRPDAPVAEAPRCDAGHGAMLGDAVVALALGAGAAGAFDGGEVGAGAALLTVAGIFAASAVHANTVANDCSRAVTAHATYAAAEADAAIERRRVARAAPVRPTGAPGAAPGTAPAPRVAPAPAQVAPAPPSPAAPPPEVAPAAPAPEAPAPDDRDWSAFWELVR